MTPPPYFLRRRGAKAEVFRVDAQNRHGRIEMTRIAVVDTRTGEARVLRGQTLEGTDDAAIRDWLAGPGSAKPEGAAGRAVAALNRAAHWAQAKAGDEELDVVTDDLLMAMHDLRGVLVRRRAERVKDG